VRLTYIKNNKVYKSKFKISISANYAIDGLFMGIEGGGFCFFGGPMGYETIINTDTRRFLYLKLLHGMIPLTGVKEINVYSPYPIKNLRENILFKWDEQIWKIE
jgi:hypothetical protein